VVSILEIKFNNILERIGFKQVWNPSWGWELILNSQLKNNKLFLYYKIKETETNHSIICFLNTGDKVYHIEGDFDSVVTKLNSLILTIGLPGLTHTFNVINNIKQIQETMDVTDIVGFKNLETKGSMVKEFNVKEYLINNLEECLEQLKKDK
jgi:hypothetical protein